tara:strand:- start:774 stop:1502 length:729 start_codon:yes stop_codon:yes gene_type:complete
MSDSIERISPEYLKTQEEMHTGFHKGMQYGSISYVLWDILIKPIVEKTNAKSVFDYGCGKQYLREYFEDMGIEYTGYDPAIEKYSTLDLSKQYDLVISIDVMEHVEVEYQETILEDMSKLSKGFILITISPCWAKKVLSDGRNAHICQAGPSYWLPKICKYSEPIHLANCLEDIPGFYVLSRKKIKKPIINQMGTTWNGSFKETEFQAKKIGVPIQTPLPADDTCQLEWAKINAPEMFQQNN